jgi:hypothetical protein
MAESILLYASTNDGLFILSKPGTSKEWLPPRHALVGQAVRASQAQPGPPIQVTALVGDPPAAMVSMNGGRTWEETTPPEGFPAEAAAPLLIPAMKSDLPPVLLEARDGVLYRSEDGSVAAAAPVADAPPDVRALTPDPLRRERVYAGTGAGAIFTSADRGKTWQQLEVTPLPAIRHLAVLRIG